MKKNIFILFFFVYSCLAIKAQDDEQGLKGQFYLAPDFGLMLGTISLIEVSPALGYYITPRLNAAIGFKYKFYSETWVYSTQDPIKTHIFGPRAFARYTIFNDLGDFLPVGINTSLFGHTEFESSSLEEKHFGNSLEPGRFWYSTVLVGGGISQSASERVHFSILVLWDTYTGSASLNSSPVIRFGIQFFLRPRMQELY